MFLLREESGLTISETGIFLGGRSHSTIVEALKRYGERRESEPSLMQTEAAARRLLSVKRRRS